MTAILLDKGGSKKLKCPVPRPILRILTSSRASSQDSPMSGMERTSMESKARQMRAFREQHQKGGAGMVQAEAFLECVLSLSVDGVEVRGGRGERSEATRDSWAEGYTARGYV